MGKAEKSWSGMRRYLEKEMLAPSLSGRVRYHCASYTGMENGLRFEVYIDGEKACLFSMETMAKALYDGPRPIEPDQLQSSFWNHYWQEKRSTSVSERDVYDDMEFADALTRYRQQTIEASLNDEDPIVRMFAVLDRRVGKRTLEKLRERITEQPSWLAVFYRLRFKAEGIYCSD